MMKRLFLTTIIMLATLWASAQVTTSGMDGRVTHQGQEVIGAVIKATHQPSGTIYHAVTNNAGRFNIQGMRVGGPYEVRISYIGFRDEVIEDIDLDLGETENINIVIEEDAEQLAEVVVAGKAGKGSNGASSNFSRTMIENAPTIDRSIYDVAKLSPMVNVYKSGGVSIAGTNNRYNSFQIDGVASNDVFGLAGTGTNGGQTGANPISMDAIEQIQVAVSPFDIRQSGFTGGAINAITKSGTNKFTGSAYTYYTDENMYSRWSQLHNKKQKLTDEKVHTYGFTFGGPIVKDKLFFFSSMEYVKDSYPASFVPGQNGYFLNAGAAQAILDRYASITGFHDSYDHRDIERRSVSLLGRIDWAINSRHKFSLRYQFNDSYRDNAASSATIYYFNHSGYRMKNKTHSFVAELNSQFSEHVYNELRVSGSFVRDKRHIEYPGPLIYIQNAGDYDVTTGNETSGSYQIGLGTEYSSGANSLKQSTWTIEDNVSWYLGDHALTFGTHNEFYNIKNAFIQAANGEFVYSGITSFLTFPDTPSSYVYKYSDMAVTGTTMWETPFKAGQLGFYAQDKWSVTPLLQVTMGLRVDLPVYFNSPSVNEEFNATDYSIKNDAVVGRRPKTMPMFSPRLGFRWYLNEQRSSLLRGGLGIFNGRAPFVWIENAWANTGIELKGTTIRSQVPTFVENGNKHPLDIINNAKGTADKPAINTVDRNFRFPQVFRMNLAWEYMLPWNVKMSLEGLFSKNIYNAWFENLALSDDGPVYAVPGVANSAATYYKSDVGGYSNIINLTNSNKGYSYSLTAKFDKQFPFGLDVMASYTFGRSYSVHDGNSSVAYSNWAYNLIQKTTEATLSPSAYDIPHRLMVQLSYNSPKYGNGRWQTHATLTYNGSSGQRYSLAMDDTKSSSFNGDYRKGNSLIYIPTAEELQKMNFADITDGNGNVTMSADAQRAAFEQWISNDRYAKDHRGQFAERNSNATPWENHFDLHLAQDFLYLKERGSKIQLVFDIINLANLLNHDWGTVYTSSFSQPIIKCIGVNTDSNGQRSGVFNFTQAMSPAVNDIASRWHMQLGLRVTF